MQPRPFTQHTHTETHRYELFFKQTLKVFVTVHDESKKSLMMNEKRIHLVSL